MGRYCRDEIILQGLDIAHCPTVTERDAPGGILQPNAMSIKWLQNALDMFHKKYPFESDITEATMLIPANSEDLLLYSDQTKYRPSDFIIDVKHGITGLQNTSPFQVDRVDYSEFRGFKRQYYSNLNDIPLVYCKVNSRIKIAPKIKTSILVTLEYYALAPPLTPSSEPNFPDEWSLIEFIHLKAKEWTRALEPGTAQLYFQKQLAGFRSSGLLGETEFNNAPPIESYSNKFNYYNDRNSWMGKPSA